MEIAQDNDPRVLTGRRAHSRLRLSLPAKVDLICGPTQCSLENLSTKGARLALPDCPPVNALGLLHCEALEACFTVIWRIGSRCGVLFDRPAPEKTVVDLRWFTDNTRRLELEQLRRQAMDWVGISGQAH